FSKIPAGKEPTELTLEECLVIAGIKKTKKGKVEVKSKISKVKVTDKKHQAKKSPVSQPRTPNSKLKIVKAKRKFAGKRK
ncbi:MAG: hypothetical protein AABZ32_07150, partial [Bacteroidota bacterium]